MYKIARTCCTRFDRDRDISLQSHNAVVILWIVTGNCSFRMHGEILDIMFSDYFRSCGFEEDKVAVFLFMSHSVLLLQKKKKKRK